MRASDALPTHASSINCPNELEVPTTAPPQISYGWWAQKRTSQDVFAGNHVGQSGNRILSISKVKMPKKIFMTCDSAFNTWLGSMRSWEEMGFEWTSCPDAWTADVNRFLHNGQQTVFIVCNYELRTFSYLSDYHIFHVLDSHKKKRWSTIQKWI